MVTTEKPPSTNPVTGKRKPCNKPPSPLSAKAQSKVSLGMALTETFTEGKVNENELILLTIKVSTL